jgi:hypothetical protein
VLAVDDLVLYLAIPGGVLTAAFAAVGLWLRYGRH